jgi:hypothetical protein
VEDLEEEIRLRGAGVDPLSKNAAEDEEQEGAAANFFGDLVGGKFSIAEPGVGFLASMGGIYGGYKLADYIADARKKSKMSGDIDQKRNEIDKLIYDEYMRTRGITKDASFTRPTSVDLDRRKGALEQLGQNPIESGSRLAAIGYTTIGMLTLALAYKYSKDYHNKNDPARARIKQLEGVAKRRAMQTQAPLFLEAGSLPDIQAGAKRIAPPKPKAPTRVSTTPGIKTADPTDPLGSILNA